MICESEVRRNVEGRVASVRSTAAALVSHRKYGGVHGRAAGPFYAVGGYMYLWFGSVCVRMVGSAWLTKMNVKRRRKSAPALEIGYSHRGHRTAFYAPPLPTPPPPQLQ